MDPMYSFNGSMPAQQTYNNGGFEQANYMTQPSQGYINAMQGYMNANPVSYQQRQQPNPLPQNIIQNLSGGYRNRYQNRPNVLRNLLIDNRIGRMKGGNKFNNLNGQGLLSSLLQNRTYQPLQQKQFGYGSGVDNYGGMGSGVVNFGGNPANAAIRQQPTNIAQIQQFLMKNANNGMSSLGQNLQGKSQQQQYDYLVNTFGTDYANKAIS